MMEETVRLDLGVHPDHLVLREHKRSEVSRCFISMYVHWYVRTYIKLLLFRTTLVLVHNSCTRCTQGIHAAHKGYTLHTRDTHCTQGIHTVHKGYTLYTRDTHCTQGIHTVHKGYTLHTRDTRCTQGIHAAHKGYTLYIMDTQYTYCTYGNRRFSSIILIWKLLLICQRKLHNECQHGSDENRTLSRVEICAPERTTRKIKYPRAYPRHHEVQPS